MTIQRAGPNHPRTNITGYDQFDFPIADAIAGPPISIFGFLDVHFTLAAIVVVTSTIIADNRSIRNIRPPGSKKEFILAVALSASLRRR